MDEVRTQDVGQFPDQFMDIGPETLRLAILQALPGVLEQTKRHRLVVADDIAVDLHRGTQAAQAVVQEIVAFRADGGDREVPHLRQRAGGAFGDQGPDFPLEPVGVLPQPFWVAVRDVVERAIDQSGKRLHRLAAAADQHDREIIAQRREIAIAGEHGGLQIALGERVERAARDSAGEVKGDERLKFCLHVRFALTVFA